MDTSTTDARTGSGLALHWKILIGLALGILAGLAINAMWTTDLGVDGRRGPGRVPRGRGADDGADGASPNADASGAAHAARFVRDLNGSWAISSCAGLRLIAVPIVVFSLIVGASSSLNDLAKLSRIGGKTIGIYVVTTAISITVGLVSRTSCGRGPS